MHPLKLVKIKNNFGFFQKNPQILAERVEPFSNQKNVFLKHASDHLGSNHVEDYKYEPGHHRPANIGEAQAEVAEGKTQLDREVGRASKIGTKNEMQKFQEKKELEPKTAAADLKMVAHVLILELAPDKANNDFLHLCC